MTREGSGWRGAVPLVRIGEDRGTVAGPAESTGTREGANATVRTQLAVTLGAGFRPRPGSAGEAGRDGAGGGRLGFELGGELVEEPRQGRALGYLSEYRVSRVRGAAAHARIASTSSGVTVSVAPSQYQPR